MPRRKSDPETEEQYNITTPNLCFRITKAKKDYLCKYYGKLLPQLLREQADILIVRSLNMENK